jgi:thiol-disulfide isomerase/thioredoxin
LSGSAVRLASSSGDEAALERWVSRHREMGHPRDIAYGYLRDARLREIGAAVARERIERLLEHRASERALGHTAPQQVREQRREAGYLRAAIGRALLAAGDPAAARAELSEAVRLEPAEPNLRLLAEAHTALGDAGAALGAWARVAATREDRTAFADSVWALFPDAFEPAGWEVRVAAIRAELLAGTRATATERFLPEVALQARDGSRTTLSALAHGQPTLVVFVSRFCGPSMEMIPRVQALADVLAGTGVRVVPITHDGPTPDYLQPYAEAGVSLPIYHDATGGAGLAFNNSGTPQFYVLDRAGTLRFEQSTFADLQLQLAVLREEGPAPPGS